MEFLFSGDIIRPATIAIEAKDQDEATSILEIATHRGNLEDSRISLFDEDSAQHLAAFQWDGEVLEENTVDIPRLTLVRS